MGAVARRQSAPSNGLFNTTPNQLPSSPVQPCVWHAPAGPQASYKTVCTAQPSYGERVGRSPAKLACNFTRKKYASSRWTNGIAIQGLEEHAPGIAQNSRKTDVTWCSKEQHRAYILYAMMHALLQMGLGHGSYLRIFKPRGLSRRRPQTLPDRDPMCLKNKPHRHV